MVRRATATEELITLDGETRQLTEENIVITNGKTPVGLAGVMGGANSEISQETTTVALEAALFNPLSIRKTSKQFNLRVNLQVDLKKASTKRQLGWLVMWQPR